MHLLVVEEKRALNRKVVLGQPSWPAPPAQGGCLCPDPTPAPGVIPGEARDVTVWEVYPGRGSGG